MECAVRPAALGDCPAITRLNREELGYDYPQEKTFAQLQACLANPAHAVFCGGAWGRGGGLPPPGGVRRPLRRPHGKRAGIAVSSACRRQGVGRALLAAGEAWARSQGAEQCALSPANPGRAPTPFTQAWGIRATSSSGTSKRTSHKRGRNGLSFFAWKRPVTQGIL